MRSHRLIWTLSLCLSLLVSAAPAQAEYAGFSDPGARSSGGAGAGGGLVPVIEEVDGGKIPLGATAQVVVRFRNDGSQPVETGLIRLYPSSTVSGAVSLNQCEEEPLPAGAECAIALSVKGLQAGSWRLEMLMSHSGRTRLVTTTLSGDVEATGDANRKLTSDIEAVPDELDYGTLENSQTLTRPVVLRNITSTPIDITDIYVDSSDQSGYSLKTECKRLDPGQSCIAIVAWAPRQKGRSMGVLVVRHTGPAALTSVELTGEYSPDETEEAEIFPQPVPGKGLLVASQVELGFGTGVQTASSMTVSLVNAGDADVEIKDIKISGADNGISYKEDGCMKGTILEPIEACPLTVTWSPTRVGAVFDDVQVLHTGARGVLVIPVRGTATSTVSQDQKAILLSGGGDLMTLDPSQPPSLPAEALEGEDDSEEARIAREQERAARRNQIAVSIPTSTNPSSVLDGYKITSFSPTRAIINGPGGSRLVFDNEEIVLGGIPWFVVIQKNGIEFLHQGQRILLLFDRSLSSINRISASSESGGSSNTGGSNSTPSRTPSSSGNSPNG